MAGSLFASQTRALLLRSYHWERRQYCNLVCNFIVPSIFIILLRVLSTALTTTSKADFPFQEAPKLAFAPRPFNPAACFELAQDTSPEAAAARCRPNEFIPSFNVPVTAVGSDALTIANELSLGPFVYDRVLPGGDAFQSQSPYDGVLKELFEGDTSNPTYSKIVADEANGKIDDLYGKRVTNIPSIGTLRTRLYDEWNDGGFFGRYASAYHIREASLSGSSATVDATVYYNESLSTNCTEQCSVVSNVARFDNAIFSAMNPGKVAMAYLRRFPIIEKEDDFGFIQLIISIIIGLVSHFLFPSFLRFLVLERVSRLRSMMSIMGLRRSQYWFGTYIGLLIIYVLSFAVFSIVGAIMRIPFYVDNTPVSYLVLFFLWGNILISLAMLFQPFFSNPETAQIVGWLFVILVNLVGGPYIGQKLSDDTTTEGTWAAIMILPSFAFVRSVYYAGAFNSGGKGVTLKKEEFRGIDLGMCSDGGPFCRSYIFLFVEWIVILLVALYLDRVLPNSEGNRLHPLFFLGFKRKIQVVKETTDEEDTRPDDVIEEEQRARMIAANIASEPFEGVVLDRLTKTYPAKPPVKALKQLSLVAKKNEVLCILAHNGAGKTTCFRTLVGELAASSGSAYVYGNSILNEMDIVRRNMGVAPQQDILWTDLTVQEHLYFYGRIKNLSNKELKEAVAEAADNVQLGFARRRKVKQLSGGMKRRLSVSIALIGDPQFIILDEPSTGLDILAREKLWQTIERVKPNKTIMLTTHSLDEAETLSSRVAIMSRGELKCIGKVEELKLRLGKGHRLSVSLPPDTMGELQEGIMKLAPGATLEMQMNRSMDFILPRTFPIASILEFMKQHKRRLRIRDWSLHQSSLEDVFMRVTHASQREALPKDPDMADDLV